MNIHPELNRLLDWTWTNRVPIMVAALATGEEKGSTHTALKDQGSRNGTANDGIYMIYNEYTALPANEQTDGAITNADIQRFLRELSVVQTQLRPRPEVLLQIASNFEDVNIMGLAASSELLRYKRSFFHFRKKRAACSHRVYINLREAMRGLAFTAVLSEIWDIDGVCSAKVAAPGLQRADTALVYCAGQESQRHVVDALKAYHKRNKGNFFGHSLPKLVEPVPGAHGIGKATEPPHLHLMSEGEGEEAMFFAVGTPQSFGLYRATIIFTALERTEFPEDIRGRMRHGVRESDDETKDAFKHRVKQYFEVAGLSVTNPAQQGPTGDYLDVSAIAHHFERNGRNAGRP